MELFKKIPHEKQRLIIDNAYTCFGKNGYKKASMADIAYAAGISKASLFHYFGNKKSLYLFLYQYAMDEILSKSLEGSEDFFECIQKVSAIKMEVMAKYPGLFEFLSSTVEEDDPEVMKELKALSDKNSSQGMSLVFAKVDWGRFKPENNRQMAINAITWISEGYVRSALGHKDAVTMQKELAAYMEMLKKSLYREEYLK